MTPPTFAFAVVLAGALSGTAAAGDIVLPKKQAYLVGKTAAHSPSSAQRRRLDTKLERRLYQPPSKLLLLRNTWTSETLVLDAGPTATVDSLSWDRFLRCHFTNQMVRMDLRLLAVLAGAARQFRKNEVYVISAYRAPKYQLMLRKKGREVAKSSQHTDGNAIDFRIPGVPLRRLRTYVQRFHPGGVGYYPQSQFVHADTGPRRTWTGR